MFDSVESLLSWTFTPAASQASPADEVALVKQIADEHHKAVVDETLQKIFEEHNGANPHTNPAEQCQCVNCVAYRAESQK
jgi:hypothetical protein